MKRHIFLDGDEVALGTFGLDSDFEDMARWINDGEVTHYLYAGIYPVDSNDTRRRLADDQKASPCVVFSILVGEDDRFIGKVGLFTIDSIARGAEFRIFIGDKSWRGRGIGTETTKMVLEYGFARLHLHRIWLGVNAEHKAAVCVYEKCGFVREGLLREAFWRNGRYYDLLRMSILRKEHEGKICTEQQSLDVAELEWVFPEMLEGTCTALTLDRI